MISANCLSLFDHFCEIGPKRVKKKFNKISTRKIHFIQNKIDRKRPKERKDNMTSMMS